MRAIPSPHLKVKNVPASMDLHMLVSGTNPGIANSEDHSEDFHRKIGNAEWLARGASTAFARFNR
jgi:hypothetical protein